MSLKNTIIAISIVFIAALFLSESEPKPYAQWEYEGELGQKNWSKLDERFAICKDGLNQSPVDITTAIKADLIPLIFEEKSKATTFTNNGNFLKVDFQGGNHVYIDNIKYILNEINFHAPSENKIDGESFPMEAQLVHRDSKNNIAIVSIFFEEGSDNFVLNRLLRNLPENKNETQDIKSEVFAYEILPSLREYYRFNGSLTTPPCTEGVKWIIMKTTVELSKSQLNDFTKVIPNNARDIQEINARIILD